MSVKVTKSELLQAVRDAVRPPLLKDGEEAGDMRGIGFPNVRATRNYGQIPVDEFSFVRLINGIRNHDVTGFEREVLDESIKQRALGTDESSTYGGYFVGEQFLPEEFVAFYHAASICRAAGVRVLQCRAPVKIPKSTGSVTTYWVAENADITLSDPTPGQISLSPKLLAARTQLSKSLLRMSGGVAEQIIRQDMAEAIAAAEDLAILEGTGSSNQPTGMTGITGINEVEIGTNGGAITVDLLRDMELALQVDNVKFRRPAWLMHPRTWHGICSFLINSETNRYLINPGIQDITKKALLGYPVYLSTQISIDLTKGTGENLANIFLTDMSDVILAEWGGIEIDVSDQADTAWKQYGVQVRAVKSLDINARNPESICLINDSTT